MPIRFLDMFAGIGGFRSGLERLGGFECVGYCEIDKYAKQAYDAMYPTKGELYFADARTIDPYTLPDIDLICGGFPCQSFSIAGLRKGFQDDTRGTLFFEIARIAAVKRPPFLLLENVPGLLSHDQGRTFATILGALDELGYDVAWQILNSKDFGVPQSRKRVYIVGYLRERCAGEILSFTNANAASLIQLLGGTEGNRVYSDEGVGITLTSNAGGFGGKTGLYDVALPIKVDTKSGFQLAHPGDSIDLPMASDILANYAAAFNEADIGDCVYYDFESVIPQITPEMFGSMSDVQTLNKLAAEIRIMSESEQVKFKAVLDAGNTASIHDALNAAQNLWRYEFTAEPDTADAFFKKYILENTSTEFDSRWLENLLPRNEADKLLGRIGAAVTDYGVISARNGHLFEPVPYDEPEAKELKTQAMTEEKLDVIEVLDRRALFSNGRLMPEQIPEGLYAYDLRHSDDGDRFCSIEPKVGVNHGGTVLMRDILDFGESGYIPLDEDTEPNFLGDEMTPSEFAEEEAQDETLQMGGM